MNVCPICGKEIQQENPNFCSSCGESLKNINQEMKIEKKINDKPTKETKKAVSFRNKYFQAALVMSVIMLFLPSKLVLFFCPVIIFLSAKGYGSFKPEEVNKWHVYLAFALSGLKLLLVGIILFIILMKPGSRYNIYNTYETEESTEVMQEIDGQLHS